MGFQSPAGTSGPVSGIPDPALKNNRDVLIWDGADWIASRVDWTELTGKPATFAPTIHGDTEHDATVASLSAGLVPNGELAGSGTPDATTFLRGDRTWMTPAGGGGGVPLLSVPFVYDAGWTNQPAGLVNFLGSAGRPIVRFDLDWAAEINLQIGLRAAGFAGSVLRVYYSDDDITYATTGAEVSQTTAGFIESGWIALPVGAQIADCYLKLMGESGDGIADPQYSHITAFIR